jgi:hypothetical protein
MFSDVPPSVWRYMTSLLLPDPGSTTRTLRGLRGKYQIVSTLRLVNKGMGDILSNGDLDATFAKGYHHERCSATHQNVSNGGSSTRWLQEIHDGEQTFAALFAEWTAVQACIDDYMTHMVLRVPGPERQFIAMLDIALRPLQAHFERMGTPSQLIEGDRFFVIRDLVGLIRMPLLSDEHHNRVHVRIQDVQHESFFLRYIHEAVPLSHVNTRVRGVGRTTKTCLAAADTRCLTPKVVVSDELFWCVLDVFANASRLRTAIDSVGRYMQQKREFAVDLERDLGRALLTTVQHQFRSCNICVSDDTIRTMLLSDAVPPIHRLMVLFFYGIVGDVWHKRVMRDGAPLLASRILFGHPHIAVPRDLVEYFTSYFSTCSRNNIPDVVTMPDIALHLSAAPGCASVLAAYEKGDFSAADYTAYGAPDTGFQVPRVSTWKSELGRYVV